MMVADEYGLERARMWPYGTSSASGLSETRALGLGRRRIIVAAALMVVAYTLIGARLAGLAVSEPGEAPVFARGEVAEYQRADILDRHGRLLATDMGGFLLAVDTWKVVDAPDAARRIAGVLPTLDAKAVEKKISGRRGTVWLKRELTPQQRFEVHDLGLPGVRFVQERRRVYPQGPVLAHVMGHADHDGNGRAGVELALDQRLKNVYGPPAETTLSIDLRFQHALRDELKATMDAYRAKGAAGVVLDVRNGEVLALASLPDFDPNDPVDALKADRINRVTMGAYEFGSTLKAFTLAMALDSGVVTLDDTYDVTDPISWGRFKIRDYKRHEGELSVAEIFRVSSNIGTAKIALDAGTPRQREYLKRFGLLDPVSVELPEVGAPVLPRRWGEIETMTVSYGHGIAVTMLQLASAASALVNGGCAVEPTLIKRERGEIQGCRRVISERTSRVMRDLLRDVVENGTGRRAHMQGYPIGGKTGSAEKAKFGGYDHRALLSSFLGVFPAHEPRYLLLVAVDEPRPAPNSHQKVTGGITAAPAVAKVVQRIGPMVAIAPVREGDVFGGPLIVASN